MSCTSSFPSWKGIWRSVSVFYNIIRERHNMELPYRFPCNQAWKRRVSPFPPHCLVLWNQTGMYQVEGGGGRTSFLMEFHPDSFPPFSLGLLEGGVGACLPMLPLAGRCSCSTKNKTGGAVKVRINQFWFSSWSTDENKFLWNKYKLKTSGGTLEEETKQLQNYETK